MTGELAAAVVSLLYMHDACMATFVTYGMVMFLSCTCWLAAEFVDVRSTMAVLLASRQSVPFDT